MRHARETAGVLSEELGLPAEASESIHELRESDEYLALPPEEQKLRRWSVWMAEGRSRRFFLVDSLLEDRFGAQDVGRLWRLRTVNCGLSVFEHDERHHHADPRRGVGVRHVDVATRLGVAEYRRRSRQ